MNRRNLAYILAIEDVDRRARGAREDIDPTARPGQTADGVNILFVARFAGEHVGHSVTVHVSHTGNRTAEAGICIFTIEAV